MSHRAIPSGFVKSILHNGVGRHVCQMQRVTLKFCKRHADSRGMRDFIENYLLEFVNKNPGIVVYLQPRRHRTPKLVAEYLNGRMEHVDAANKTAPEVCQWLEHLRCRSGEEIIRLRKPWHTDTPSIQGIWTPFTNLEPQLAVTALPDDRFSLRRGPETATEHLLKVAGKLSVFSANNNGQTSVADTSPSESS